MADRLGSYNTSGTKTHVRFQFTTHAASGAAVAPSSAFENADIRIYKATDGAAFSNVQRSSSAGVVMVSPFDTVTGLHDVDIDLTDNTDASFYAAGSTYSVVLSPDTETVDALSVVRVLAYFDIGPQQVNVTQWLGTAASTPTVAGVPNVNAKTWNDLATVELPLVPTTAGRKLDVSTGGEAGLDWANVGSPTTTLDLSGTTIKTTQKVDVDTIKTNPVVNGGTLTFPTTATLASTTNITAGTVTTATNVTTVNGLASGVITATSIAADAITAAKVADGTIDAATFATGAITAAAIAADAIGASELAADAVTEIQSGLSTLTAANIRTAVGLASANLDTQLAALQADTDDVQTRLPAALVSGRIDASVGAMATDTLTATALATSAVTEIQSGLSTLDAAAIRTAVGLASANLDTQLTAIDDYIDTEVAAIKAKTDNLPSDPADASDIAASFTSIASTLTTIAAYIDTEVAAIKAKTDNLPAAPAATGDAMALTSGERTTFAGAILDLTSAIETGLTLRQAVRLIVAAEAGKVSGMATTTVVIRNAVADAKARITATVDSDGNRSAVSTDLT